MVHSINGV
jgi:hypothetical protein